MSKIKEKIIIFLKSIYKRFQNNSVKVSLFVIGAQKAGTTALHNYLIKHPDVKHGESKELHFFNHQEKYEKGISWYHKQFVRPLFYDNSNVYVDSSPHYLSDLEVAKRLYNYNPNAKIVILLRDPVKRAFSAWNMYKQLAELSSNDKESLIKSNIEKKYITNFRNLINTHPFPSFEDFVSKELQNNTIVDYYPNIFKTSLYVQQVKPYLDLFDNDNIFIYESEYFKTNKLKVTNLILKQAGLKKLEVSEEDLKKVHSRTYNSPINKETELKLKAFYKPYNEQLFELIGKRFDW